MVEIKKKKIQICETKRKQINKQRNQRLNDPGFTCKGSIPFTLSSFARIIGSPSTSSGKHMYLVTSQAVSVLPHYNDLTVPFSTQKITGAGSICPTPDSAKKHVFISIPARPDRVSGGSRPS